MLEIANEDAVVGGRATCPLCDGSCAERATIRDIPYFECGSCDFIFADPGLLARVDAGESLRKYDADYWQEEISAARERSFGSSLARVAEAILYCRIPVQRFIDIGAGPGHLLDALRLQLPAHADRFFAVEKFPPAPDLCTDHGNYMRMDLADVVLRFECGVCIEVIEHLTPTMLSGLARSLDRISVPGSLFLFNTGLTDYVRNEDPGYLDFHVRGHITCWSVTAARKVFEPAGFEVHPLRGKTWAFVVEKPLEGAAGSAPLEDRIWTPPAENVALLRDPDMGDVMYLLGRESARAY